jgi:hypothetical protein
MTESCVTWKRDCVVSSIFCSLLVPALAIPAPARAEEPAKSAWAAGKVAASKVKTRPPWQSLASYPRPASPDTGWGIHDDPRGDWLPPNPDQFFRELKGKYGFSWYKVLGLGANKVPVVAAARRQGVEPVVRLWVSGPSPFFPRPGKEEAEFRGHVRAYVQAGAHYFESGNEPNIGVEWVSGEFDKPDCIGRLCQQWLRVKLMIMQEGGIPVFYAMTPGSAGKWYADCFEWFKQHDKIEEAFAGAAIGAHLCSLNHPIDYPFNPEKNLPHATQAERFESLMKDNTCYRLGELIILLERKYLPYPIPILSTEGGTGLGCSEDGKYPKVTPELHREMNLDIFRRYNPASPKYWGDELFCQMSWIYHTSTGSFMMDSWFKNPGYNKGEDLPIIAALAKEPKFDRGVAFRGRGRPGR